MWLAWLTIVITVVSVSRDIRAVAAGLWVRISRVIECPAPLSIQLAEAVDSIGHHLSYPFHKNPLGYLRIFTALNIPLTTWLGHPTWAVDSYRRHLQALREHEEDLRALRSRAVRVPERG
jgi:hypothetical protein